jgi:hypothetical protein
MSSTGGLISLALLFAYMISKTMGKKLKEAIQRRRFERSKRRKLRRDMRKAETMMARALSSSSMVRSEQNLLNISKKKKGGPMWAKVKKKKQMSKKIVDQQRAFEMRNANAMRQLWRETEGRLPTMAELRAALPEQSQAEEPEAEPEPAVDDLDTKRNHVSCPQCNQKLWIPPIHSVAKCHSCGFIGKRGKRVDRQVQSRDSKGRFMPTPKHPPIPPEGLPAGWSMAHWADYGQSYLDGRWTKIDSTVDEILD